MIHPPPLKLLVGVGSPSGDDGLGWHVVDLLASHLPSLWEARKVANPTDMLDWFASVETLLVCDACLRELPGDEIQRWQWPDLPDAMTGFIGTHDFSVPDVLRLAERLGTLPDQVVILAVEIDSHSAGNKGHLRLTPRASLLAHKLAEAIQNIVQESRVASTYAHEGQPKSLLKTRREPLAAPQQPPIPDPSRNNTPGCHPFGIPTHPDRSI